METSDKVLVTKTEAIIQSKGSTSQQIIVPINLKANDFPIDIKVSGVSLNKGIIPVSPLELVLDQPINLGCYILVSPPTFHADPHLTPQNCLLACHAQDLMFAVLSGGKKCGCLAQLIQGSFTLIQEDRCHLGCVGDSQSRCGGSGAASIYLAGRLSETF